MRRTKSSASAPTSAAPRASRICTRSWREPDCGPPGRPARLTSLPRVLGASMLPCSSKPIRAALALALGAAFAVTAPPAHAASTRNYLTVEGRVTNHSGRPVRDAWVFCLGSRRASARVDTSGAYRLEIPGATLEELQRTALKIRIQARRTGWRFALPSGSPELGLEMRVVTEESKLSRLRV